MAYGVLYEFRRTSTNGADMLITISQKDYNGAVKKRALGRAPVIKRDNNGHIYGTSCELYAECLVDGEFSHLYTSDAYEYKVEVYKNNTLIWMGYVSPELYSEPDIAPPYDVQIIATDGLGELKNFNFQKRGVASILDHLDTLMDKTGIETSWDFVSGLRYIKEDGVASTEHDILSVKLDLDHEEGNSYYDVLQGLLSSLNANITQHNGRYLIFRETDFINKTDGNGVEAFDASGISSHLPVASFGTMKSHDWWPVGQLSTVIEPAKNKITLTSPNHYKGNVLRFDSWTMGELASYSEADNAYVLPGASSYITQNITFGYDSYEVGYRLGLRVRARNVGSGTEEQNIKIEVSISGRSYSGVDKYFLVKTANTSGRSMTDYMFRKANGYIEEDLPLPTEGASSLDAQDIDIVLPLYWANPASYMYAQDVWVTISNPQGLYDIHVYDVSLVKYEQIKGYEANVIINNMARESESNIDLTITAGDLAPASGDVFMTGIPLRPSDMEIITKWQIGLGQQKDYLAAMAFDYARAISLPRMKYSGILNVPGSATILPTLFLRDGTYYFPRTYSYDLYADEITIDLISISAADVSLSSVQITQTSDAAGTMGTTTGGSSGGGGIPGASGAITKVLGVSALGTVTEEKDDVTFNAYAIDSLYKSIKTLETNKADANKVYTITQIDNLFSLLQTSIASSYLSINGGQLHGSLRLRKGSENYGMFLYFGDGNLCYLNEDYDDHLKIYASKGVSIETSSGNTLSVNGSAVMTLADLNGYATQSWVTSQGYLTSSSLSGYATQSWVNQQKFVNQSWIDGKGYATQSWVTTQGYLTNAALSGYLPKTGGTISGNLYVQGDITCDGDIAADGEISGDSLSLS